MSAVPNTECAKVLFTFSAVFFLFIHLLEHLADFTQHTSFRSKLARLFFNKLMQKMMIIINNPKIIPTHLLCSIYLCRKMTNKKQCGGWNSDSGSSDKGEHEGGCTTRYKWSLLLLQPEDSTSSSTNVQLSFILGENHLVKTFVKWTVFLFRATN